MRQHQLQPHLGIRSGACSGRERVGSGFFRGFAACLSSVSPGNPPPEPRVRLQRITCTPSDGHMHGHKARQGAKCEASPLADPRADPPWPAVAV